MQGDNKNLQINWRSDRKLTYTYTHGNQLLEKIAKTTENKVIERYSVVNRVKPTTVLQEISNVMLGSNNPGQLASASTAGAIRMKLYRKRDGEARRNFLSNAMGQDLHHNTGSRQRSLDAYERIKFIVDGFDSMPIKDYISILATDLQKYDK